MSTLKKIAEIEAEMARTQKNKATEYHLGLLRGKLARLRTKLMTPTKTAGKCDGFEVAKVGHARVSFVGFPSVGKSTLLNLLTGLERSETAAYEFTTLTCVPGIIQHRDTKIQLLDLPGIIEGAGAGRGRGRQVIATARSSDVVIFVLDSTKDDTQRRKLEIELYNCGIRLNQEPPKITVNRKMMGGISINSHTNLPIEREILGLLREYGIHNCEMTVSQENVTLDQVIDVLEGNRVYIKGVYVFNKCDMLSEAQCWELMKDPMSVLVSCKWGVGLENLKDHIWNNLGIRRIYTKRQGEPPDFKEPIIIRTNRDPPTVETAVKLLHASLLQDFGYANVWGPSHKHSPMRVGRHQELQDEDVIQVFKKK